MDIMYACSLRHKSLSPSHLERVDEVGEGESVPEGLLADEHVQDGELVDAGHDQEEVHERQVHQQLVETERDSDILLGFCKYAQRVYRVKILDGNSLPLT